MTLKDIWKKKGLPIYLKIYASGFLICMYVVGSLFEIYYNLKKKVRVMMDAK